MAKKKLQALRIEAGWSVAYHQFTEQDSNFVNHGENQDVDLLMLCNQERGKMMKLIWQPEVDKKGSFILFAINYRETYHPKHHNFDFEIDNDNPHDIFETKDRQEIIRMIEKWCKELPVTKDDFVIINQSEVDGSPKAYQTEIFNEGVGDRAYYSN